MHADVSAQASHGEPYLQVKAVELRHIDQYQRFFDSSGCRFKIYQCASSNWNDHTRWLNSDLHSTGE